MDYRNMDVELVEYATRYNVEQFRVCVTDSPYLRQTFNQAVPSRVPRNLRTKLNVLEHRQLSPAELQNLGESLGQMLFPGELQDAVADSLDRIPAEDGLRIRLKLDNFALADLPWEFVYLRKPPPGGFLALNRRISLVRYEVMTGILPTLTIGEDLVRLATLLADPTGSVEYRHLGLADEENAIRNALSKVQGLSPKFYPLATVGELGKALADRPHILHFAGHGKFKRTEGAFFHSYEGQGYLVLLDANLSAHEFEVTRLTTNLKGCGVRLVVLGACETPRRDGQNAWTGIASALTQIDIPAVVGMQYGIRNTNATKFSEHFYYSLAQGESIDSAMTAGRLAIYNDSSADERDWGVPVLYLRMAETERSPILFPRLLHRERSAPPQRDSGVNTYVARTNRCPNVNCSATVLLGAKYCEHCGYKLGYCAKCAGVVSTDARFCAWCGEPTSNPPT